MPSRNRISELLLLDDTYKRYSTVHARREILLCIDKFFQNLFGESSIFFPRRGSVLLECTIDTYILYLLLSKLFVVYG